MNQPALPAEVDRERLLALLPGIAGRRVLVVGDLCLDEYVVGHAERMSREAPVPVLEFSERFTRAGAAANPALNVSSLGGVAMVAGLVGDDEAGRELRRKLSEQGIAIDGVITDPTRPTTVKTRILAEAGSHFLQQVVRMDHAPRAGASEDARGELLRYVEAASRWVDAVLISDYKGGVVGAELVRMCAGLVRDRGQLITVDTQGDLFAFRGLTLAKCNCPDAEAVLRRPLPDDDAIARASAQLRRRLGAEAILITRGRDGMTLAEAGACFHIPATNRSDVFDVTGAGDTVIAVVSLALAAGAEYLDAAVLSNYAAGIVVRRLGNATTTPEELGEAIRAT